MAERLVFAPEHDVVSQNGAAAPDPLKNCDIYRWAMDQTASIRAGRFDQLDISNVADEIEDLGRSDYRALESRIEIVLLHGLEWEHQAERRSRSWSDPIFEHRLQIGKLLRQSPSSRARPEGAILGAYADARRIASRPTGLPLSTFPEVCPYAFSEVMGASYELDEP